MDYRGKKVAMTGYDGFLGRAIRAALENAGACVVPLHGDVRDRETFASLNHTYSYLFHFAAPSSQVLFKRQPLNCAQVTIDGFINAAAACTREGIKLIYPSTGLLSQDRENEYARCKKVCEDMALGSNIDALGIRIFATYGSGEGHKRDYASVPYLFAREMHAGRRPIVFGDGEQVRDFIYIDDTVSAILQLAERCDEKIIDLGSGVQTSFNEIIATINDIASAGIEPIYVGKPGGYVSETTSNTEPLLRYYEPRVGLRAGLKQILTELGKS